MGNSLRPISLELPNLVFLRFRSTTKISAQIPKILRLGFSKPELLSLGTSRCTL